MNQILMTNDKKDKVSHDIKSVVKFFAIIIIVVSLIFIGEGSYKLYSSVAKNVSYQKPTVNIEKNGSAVNLTVTGSIGINKIEYSWNSGSKAVLKGEGKKSNIFEIEIPQGDNKLNIDVIDVEGNKTHFDEVDVSYVSTEDTIKPKVSIVKSNTQGKITISATDETELDHLVYKWENEEEVNVQPTEEDKKVITQEISIEEGTKKLTVTAYDKQGNKGEISKNIIGSNGPTVNVSVEDNNFIVKVTDKNAITKIEYTFNDEVFTKEDIPDNSKEYEFKLQLRDGANYLKVNAYEGELMTEYKCKKTK